MSYNTYVFSKNPSVLWTLSACLFQEICIAVIRSVVLYFSVDVGVGGITRTGVKWNYLRDKTRPKIILEAIWALILWDQIGVLGSINLNCKTRLSKNCLENLVFFYSSQ